MYIEFVNAKHHTIYTRDSGLTFPDLDKEDPVIHAPPNPLNPPSINHPNHSHLPHNNPSAGHLHPPAHDPEMGRRLFLPLLLHILLRVLPGDCPDLRVTIKHLHRYTFFYFSDVLESTLYLAKWNRRISNELDREFPYGELDIRENVDVLVNLSNKIKSFIFLVCYLIVFLVSSLVLIHIPYVGRLNLIIS